LHGHFVKIFFPPERSPVVVPHCAIAAPHIPSPTFRRLSRDSQSRLSALSEPLVASSRYPGTKSPRTPNALRACLIFGKSLNFSQRISRHHSRVLPAARATHGLRSSKRSNGAIAQTRSHALPHHNPPKSSASAEDLLEKRKKYGISNLRFRNGACLPQAGFRTVFLPLHPLCFAL